MARKKTTTITRQVETLPDEATGEEEGAILEEAPEEEGEREKVSLAPLFETASKRRKEIEKIYLYRLDPAEGYLGYVGPDATEADIFARYGGGTFDCQGRNAHGVILARKRTEIAGDPIWQSEVKESQWRRANGLGPKAKPASDEGEKLTLKDVMLMIEERDEKRRQETETREERIRRENAEREEKWRRDAEERDNRRRQDEEERRRRERDEDERRREREREQHRQDMERAKADSDRAISQQQQFMQTMLQIQAANAPKETRDPVTMLVEGMKLAKDMTGGGDGETDPVAAFLSRLPETLAEVRNTAGAVYREIKTGKGGGEGDELTIKGETASKMKRVAEALVKQGKDPEAVFSALADKLLGAGTRPQLPPKPAAPAAPAASAAPAAPPAAPPAASAPRRTRTGIMRKGDK